MRRRLAVVLATLAIILIAGFAIPLERLGVSSARERLTIGIIRDAYRMADQAVGADGDWSAALSKVAPAYAKTAKARVTVVAADGIALVDTEDEPGRDFSTRPEFIAALSGKEGVGSRISETLGTELVFAAVPVRNGGKVVGALRLSVDGNDLSDRAWRYRIALALAAIASAALAAFIASVLTSWVVGPLSQLRDTVRAQARGDRHVRANASTGPPEVRELARVANESADRFEELLAERTRFSADAAHQLRTPLAALRLRLEVAATTTPSADMDAALVAVDRLEAVCDDLLSLAKSGALTATLQEVDLDGVLRSQLVEWDAAAIDRNVRLEMVTSNGCKAFADARLLRGCVDELVANALDAAKEGGGGGRIIVSIEANQNVVLIKVDDNGAGLEEENLIAAFDPFWRRSHRTDSFGNSGLGLPQVRNLMRTQRGRCWLEKSALGGVCAVLELNATEPDITKIGLKTKHAR